MTLWTTTRIFLFLLTQSCLILCDPTDCSKPDTPVFHHLLEFAQTHVHWVSDAINHLVPFSSCLQFFPASGSFLESALRVRWPKYWSFSFSISPSNECSELIPFRITVLISLQSKGLSKVFSSTTIWKHQFFGIQRSLWSNSHIHTWLLEKP